MKECDVMQPSLYPLGHSAIGYIRKEVVCMNNTLLKIILGKIDFEKGRTYTYLSAEADKKRFIILRRVENYRFQMKT